MNISDENLYAHSSRAKGQTVIITGGGNGLGRAAAIEFGNRGSQVVIGDIDMAGADATVETIRSAGGEAISQRCDVRSWDDLSSLFKLAQTRFGTVDIVIPNAGVTEVGRFTTISLDEQGEVKKPNLKTLEINIVSVVNTTHLGLHYLRKNIKPGSLRAIVFIGSMASISGITGAPLYGAAKHGVIGFMRALRDELTLDHIRVAAVTPFFADTAIVPPAMKLFLSGIPLTPVDRVAGAIFLAATDTAPDTHGAVYSLPDDREVFRIPHVALNEGVYALIDNRARRIFGLVENIKITFGFVGVLLNYRLVRVAVLTVVGYALAKKAMQHGLM